MNYPRRPAPHSVSGSALVLTLLITALLATIVVSFLSTSRVEQMAARNFSRQNAASGLAESATQQAMAQIQLGFNTTANMTGNYTSVVTTQPGAIHKYFFQNGTITWNSTVEQFSAGNMSINGSATQLSASISNATAYLNNLQSPSSNSSATSNQWTITGNASERINVFMENVTTTVNGTNQTVGRIAYYVDDEGSKLNLNAATDNRSTLNVADSRSLSLTTLTSNSTILGKFRNTTQGTYNGTSDIKSWAYFFRPEQALASGNATSGGLNLSPDTALPFLTALPPSDFHIKYTPWGTDRLFINDLPIDSTGVNAIYEALSGKNATTGNLTADQALRNIYGTTFAEKYTDAGLKQIAANILQARDPNVLNDPTKSFTYNGSLLGAANATTDLVAIANCCDTANATKVIPKDYLGNAPYPILNEIGVTVTFTVFKPNDAHARFYVRPFISIFNPWKDSFPEGVVRNWTIEMQIDSFTFEAEHEIGGVIKGPYKYGPKGYKAFDSWGHSMTESDSNMNLRNPGLSGKMNEHLMLGTGFLSYSLNGSSSVTVSGGNITFSLPSYAEELGPGEELQFPCPPFHNTNNNTCGFRLHVGITPAI